MTDRLTGSAWLLLYGNTSAPPPLHALVVEDDAATREMLRRALEGEGLNGYYLVVWGHSDVYGQFFCSFSNFREEHSRLEAKVHRL